MGSAATGRFGPAGSELLRCEVEGAETGVRGDELMGFHRREAGAPRRAAIGVALAGGSGRRKGVKLKIRWVRLQRGLGFGAWCGCVCVCACGGGCGREWAALSAVVAAVCTWCAAMELGAAVAGRVGGRGSRRGSRRGRGRGRGRV
ncbi:hypothetical protein B0J12DRAFT_76782 [Macrophomina phaseolina]|uniref:Uncharacterized protein n=1 Tax=Macrophomina phaseolina TaxID=35725 RepID=A0ABQ8GBF1_9PEZI|nr:hypothetical protein B0J12DRAFT_76782 [Macrophomina phaseolina]